MSILRAIVKALTVPTPAWAKPIEEEPEPDPRAHLVCGVPTCENGYIVFEDEKITVVECDYHYARTTHDTTLREKNTQQVIRVQDQWRQHGVTRPPR